MVHHGHNTQTFASVDFYAFDEVRLTCFGRDLAQGQDHEAWSIGKGQNQHQTKFARSTISFATFKKIISWPFFGHFVSILGQNSLEINSKKYLFYKKSWKRDPILTFLQVPSFKNAMFEKIISWPFFGRFE